jgi:hypothetical protein
MPKLALHREASALEQIERHLKTPPIGSVVLTINPDDAAVILELYNEGNRGRKNTKIRQFAEDMKKPGWGLTGDTIKFSDKQILRDGQNRLAACVRAGVPFKSHVVFAIEDRLFAVMDRGKPRSVSDILQIEGKYTQTKNLAMAVRWVKLFDEGKVLTRLSYEPQEVLQLLRNDYSTLPEFMTKARAIYLATRAPPGLTAAILYCIDRKNKKRAAEFADAWEVGGQTVHGKPILHMLKRLAAIHEASQGRINDVVRAALAIKAWNLFSQRQQGNYKGMQWRKDNEPFPEFEGQSLGV